MANTQYAVEYCGVQLVLTFSVEGTRADYFGYPG